MVYLDFHQPQIVAIQETKIDSSELFPETCPYSVYRKDRNSEGGGGVMLLIHKDISHMPITELENNSESVWVKVFANKTSNFVGSLYQPPGRNLEELTSEIELLRSQLQKIKSMHKSNKSNKKEMNRNWSNQKANPALKTKREINKYYKWTKYNGNKLLTQRAAISQKVATQQPKLN